jgi:hypothetical protein
MSAIAFATRVSRGLARREGPCAPAAARFGPVRVSRAPKANRVTTRPDVQADLDRFLTLVLRELSAREARLLDGPEGMPGDENLQLRCALPDGRVLVALFDAPPEDRDPKQRRLEILASTFGDAVEGAASKRPSRPPVARSLREELKALCVRAGSRTLTSYL